MAGEIVYSSPVTITMDLANLGSSDTFVAGRESTEIDNTSNKYVDALVTGRISVGTGPTADRVIGVWLWGSHVAASSAAIDALVGADGARTLTNARILNSGLVLAASVLCANTSDIQYIIKPFSVAERFGGVMPPYWGLYVAHRTVVGLRNNAVNTDSFRYVGIKYAAA